MKLKKAIVTVLVAVLSLVMAAALIGCGNTDKEAKVTAIALDKATVVVETGNAAKLVATATYSDNTTKELNAGDVTWTSDTPTVATVTRGVVSGKSKGAAKITASYGGYSTTCDVTVNLIEVSISGYEANADGKVEIEVGDALQLVGKVLKNDEELASEKIVWSTSNPGTVSVKDGLISGINPGEATITATREGNTQANSVTVVVKEIEGAEKMNTFEQNKTPAKTWGYWGDQNYNWSNTTIYSAYTEEYTEADPDAGYAFIGAGKMNLTFSVNAYGGTMKPGPHEAAIQLFYRSSKSNEGVLEANHNYEAKFTIKSNTAGKIVANPYDDIEGGYATAEDNKEAHEFDIEAGVEQVITVQFRHGDSGKIYKNGVYDNVESALNLLLGFLSAPIDGEEAGNVVKLSVYRIMFKDLGESTHKWNDDPTKLEGYVDLDAPDVPEYPTLILPVEDVTVTGVTLTAEEGRAYLNLAGTINLQKFDDKAAAQKWLNDSYFDVQQVGGSWTKWEFNRTATVEDDGKFVVKYDITRLNPDTVGTGSYAAHFTEKEETEDGYNDNHYRDVKLDAEAAVHGASITVGTKKYSIVNHKDFESSEETNWGQAFNWGVVSIKVENV